MNQNQIARGFASLQQQVRMLAETQQPPPDAAERLVELVPAMSGDLAITLTCTHIADSPLYTSVSGLTLTEVRADIREQLARCFDKTLTERQLMSLAQRMRPLCGRDGLSLLNQAVSVIVQYIREAKLERIKALIEADPIGADGSRGDAEQVARQANQWLPDFKPPLDPDDQAIYDRFTTADALLMRRVQNWMEVERKLTGDADRDTANACGYFVRCKKNRPPWEPRVNKNDPRYDHVTRWEDGTPGRRYGKPDPRLSALEWAELMRNAGTEPSPTDR